MLYLKTVAIKLLEEKGIETDKALEMVDIFDTEKDIYNLLISNGIKRKEITEELEDYYAFDFFDLLEEDYKVVDHKGIENLDMLLIEKEGQNYLLTSNIYNDKKIEEARQLVEVENVRYSFDFEIAESYLREEEVEEVDKIDKVVEGAIELKEGELTVGKFLEYLIREGIDLRASDIHIEPQEVGFRTRYRIDGVLMKTTYYTGRTKFLDQIITHIKVRSGLDISERRKPQDGKLNNFVHSNIEYELRVSTVATIHGEKIVFRIAQTKLENVSFKSLGFDEETINATRSFLSRKNGIIYLSGPTGAGKTVTLHTMIDEVNNEGNNIYTIEDPVEIRTEGVNQIEINEKGGIRFDNTLEALLRQDPDIIVVGEIRNLKTSTLATNSSLTGHLILTTVHANSSAGIITRLLDMGTEPYLLGSTAIAFYAQRLVRKLCPHCKKKKEEFTEVEKAWFDLIEHKYGIKYDLEELLEHGVYEEVGCKHCYGGNYGRTAVVEYIEVDEEIRSAILEGKNEDYILDLALKNGFKPFPVKAVNLLKTGEVSLDKLIKEALI